MFNDIIEKNFLEPIYSGEIEKPQIEYEIGNSVCGDRVRIQINVQNGKIHKGVFRAWGCATSVATANLFCSSIDGVKLEEIVNRPHAEIIKMLGDLEPSQFHCLEILCDLHRNLTTICAEMGF
jgi:nitrogen fixation NifU-like protein